MREAKLPDPLVDSLSTEAATAASRWSSSAPSSVSSNDREQLEVELAADHRREPQDLERLLAEALHAALDHLAHALGQRDPRRAIDAPAAARLVEDERAGLREAAQDLADEERVAVGLGGDLRGQLEPVLVELVPGDGGHDLRHLIGAEAVQRDPLHPLHERRSASTPVSG